MRYKIVLDTNVIVSALISKNKQAATVLLFERIIARNDISVLVDDHILKEYREVLHRKKFGLDSRLVDIVLDKLESISYKVRGRRFKGTVPDAKDIMFIEASLSVPGSIIVTGNLRHFTGISNVLSPSEFVNLLENYGKNS